MLALDPYEAWLALGNYLTYKEWKHFSSLRNNAFNVVSTLPIRNTQTYIHKVGMQKLKGEQ